MADLANCSNCGKVFARLVRDVCKECFKKEEEVFNIVNRFLKEHNNQKATIQEIVEKTGVSEMIIIKLIKNKRLRTSQFPKLKYPCEKCGTDIVTGRFCDACRMAFVTNLESYHKQTIKKPMSEKSSVYYSLNKHRK